MAFNKIQPEQIQLATFFSDSGDIVINQTDTGVRLDLSRDITGDFALTGNSSHPLLINKRPVFTLADTGSNTTDPPNSGTYVFNGANNIVSGTRNIAINSNNTDFSGASTDNVLINGKNGTFGSGVENCTAIGNGVILSDAVTGAVIFTDNTSNVPSVVSSESFVVDFESGAYFQNGATRFLSHVNVGSSASGIFSGNLDVLGDTFLTGVYISGITTFNTGFTLPQWVGHSMVGTSGSLAVSGENVAVYLTGGWVGLGTTTL
jgi:hypothetical protein